MRIKPIFAWYDLWVGAFYDRAKRRLYIFPVPMIGFYLEWPLPAATPAIFAEGCCCKRAVCTYDLDFGCGLPRGGE